MSVSEAWGATAAIVFVMFMLLVFIAEQTRSDAVKTLASFGAGVTLMLSLAFGLVGIWTSVGM